MRHVIERCPTCGVEHDEAVMGACEACGDTLRPWCRRHGKEAGWLQGPVCPRCAEEAARPAPRPPRRPPSPPPLRRPSPPVRPAPWAERTAREVAREGPLAALVPPPPRPKQSGAGVVVRTTVFGSILGAMVGWLTAVWAGVDQGEVVWFGALLFGLGGIATGMIRAQIARDDET